MKNYKIIKRDGVWFARIYIDNEIKEVKTSTLKALMLLLKNLFKFE